MQAPTGRSPIERLQEVLACDRPEFGEYLLGRVEFDWQVMQPRLPRAGGAAPEVRCHVLDHQHRDEVGTLGGQAP